MPIPSSIDDLSATPGDNFPDGTDSPEVIDNVLREHAAYIAQLRDDKIASIDLAASTGAELVGANAYQTQQDINQEVVDVKRYGAVGDGVTDDSAAIQAALVYAGANGLSVFVPAGNYLMNSQAVATVAEIGGQNGFCLQGAGTHATKFIVAKSNTSGAIKLIGANNEANIYVRDVSFCSILDNTNTAERDAPNGAALWITNVLAPGVAGFGAHATHSVVVQNVFVGSDVNGAGAFDRSGSWEYGIRIENMWQPIIRDCMVRGLSNTNTTVYDPLTRVTGINKAGILLQDCYCPYVMTCKVLGYFDKGCLLYGTPTSGAWFEGGMVDSSMFVNQREGITVTSATATKPGLYESGFHITGNHINSLDYCIRLRYRRHNVISNNYIYPANATETTLALPAGIYLEATADTVISACQFLEVGFYVSDSNACVGIKIDPDTLYTQIIGCHFGSGGIGIYANPSNVQPVQAIGCIFGAQKTGAWATMVPIVDAGGTVAVLGNVDDFTRRGTMALRSTRTSTTQWPRFELTSQRTDYASNTTGHLGAVRMMGLASDGTEQPASQITTDWEDNTAASKDAETSIWVQSGNTNTQALRVSGNNKTVRVPSSWAYLIGTVGIYSGTGSPEGAVTADVGSLFLRTNGGAGTTLYVKESGTGNTGWVAK